MKTSPAGKALGPQPNEWRVDSHDSAPVIVTPGGRVLRLQQLHYGGWVPSPFDPADTKLVVEAMNLLRAKNNMERLNEQMRAFILQVSTFSAYEEVTDDVAASLRQEARALLDDIERSKTT